VTIGNCGPHGDWDTGFTGAGAPIV
jgi:hypothetical protein